MKAGFIVIAVLIVLAGGVFAGQGLGYIPGSFMTNDRTWFWIGSGMIIIGVLAIIAVVRVVGRQSRVRSDFQTFHSGWRGLEQTQMGAPESSVWIP